jgi:hypothetical protein
VPHVFISYRREDSIAYAGRLYDHLTAHFGQPNVFMDIDTLRPGVDFVEVLQKRVAACDVFLAIIGRGWLTVKDQDGNFRLANPSDFVRVEIAAALSNGVYVIPVLVGGALMPRPFELPEDLSRLARRHALEISDTTFHSAVTRLIRSIEEGAEEQRRAREAETKRRAAERQRQAREAEAKRKAAYQQRQAEEADVKPNTSGRTSSRRWKSFKINRLVTPKAAAVAVIILFATPDKSRQPSQSHSCAVELIDPGAIKAGIYLAVEGARAENAQTICTELSGLGLKPKFMRQGQNELLPLVGPLQDSELKPTKERIASLGYVVLGRKSGGHGVSDPFWVR